MKRRARKRKRARANVDKKMDSMPSVILSLMFLDGLDALHSVLRFGKQHPNSGIHLNACHESRLVRVCDPAGTVEFLGARCRCYYLGFRFRCCRASRYGPGCCPARRARRCPCSVSFSRFRSG